MCLRKANETQTFVDTVDLLRVVAVVLVDLFDQVDQLFVRLFLLIFDYHLAVQNLRFHNVELIHRAGRQEPDEKKVEKVKNQIRSNLEVL